MRGSGAPRLIPAHAGKTPARNRGHPHREAHPRSRGENPTACIAIKKHAGSSPLTRGKQPTVIPSVLWRGLIPAHAGKTTAGTSPSRWRRAHPRSRGENSSSPSWRVVLRAHPRSRGENDILQITNALKQGSSPLTRGKPSVALAFFFIPGLIPAHAGKTRRSCGAPPPGGAHPRSRGENDRPPRGVRQAPGSSPLTRGKLEGVRVAARDGGLIPAHAGKTR